MSDDKSSDLGKVTCGLRGPVVARSFQTCVRICFIGDSFAIGHGIPNGNRCTAVVRSTFGLHNSAERQHG